MSNNPERFMGGKHTMLAGDWFQLPPIGGSPCFQEPLATANRLRHAGFALYAAINFVIFLTKNMRARFDPYYTKLLDDPRWGNLTDEQMEALNTRVADTDNRDDPRTQRSIITERPNDTFFRPVVVCTNQLRCAINHYMIFQIARAEQFTLF
ncbi:hypothetical protein V7S43_007231 [Phytophthora oleae]|uniref:ATP-dependent DNA helicase n=1 Tax=Phytophthora oleae TaxID=2107226 RepID=A0ABD3FLQ9_9STRA